MGNLKLLVSDLKYLIATKCCDETLEDRVNNFLKERDSNKAVSSQPIIGGDCVGARKDVVEYYEGDEMENMNNRVPRVNCCRGSSLSLTSKKNTICFLV